MPERPAEARSATFVAQRRRRDTSGPEAAVSGATSRMTLFVSDLRRWPRGRTTGVRLEAADSAPAGRVTRGE